ncbi:MAG TPA: glycosyltransferase family 4 protein [Arachnia sp.]|nr:glycosyltransferase family 4 protein [Arachnia sp.]HMT86226.1 glycosyltransferase family 4 protein [Arachnia sp.]
MRIALVCPYNLDRPGGVATHVLGLARWLSAEGHEATVIAPGTTAPVGVRALLLGPTRDFRFNGSVAQLAVSADQRAAAARSVEGFDVVHVHEPLTPGAAYAAARAARRLVVTHHAAFSVPLPVRGVLRGRARRLGPRAAIAVSEAARRTAWEATGLEPVVLPNAIPLPSALPVERADIPKVAFLGRRDDPRKGYPLFERLTRGGAPAEFLAIGPGGPVGDGVRDLGVLSDEELARTLRGVAVVVAPNRGGESFGLVLIEALAAGCTLVVSDLPAFRDVVGGDPVAYWFAPGDHAAAAAALGSALARPADPAAARRAAGRYSWEHIGPKIVEIYSRVAFEAMA